MKVKKRVLSAVLAATMLVTSLSAGLSALAASTDDYQALADALQADGVTNATWASPTNYRVVQEDPTGDIEVAAEAFWKIASDLASSHSTAGQDNDYNTLMQIRNEILDELQSNYGFTGDKLAKATAALNAFTAGQDGANRNPASGGNWTKPSSPGARTYVFEIVRGNVADVLMQYNSAAEVPDTIYTGVSYEWFHDRWQGGSIFNYWTNICLSGWEKKNAGANTEAPAMLHAFNDLLAANYNADLTEKTPEELESLSYELNNSVTGLSGAGLWNTDLVNKLFGDYDGMDGIKTFINDVDTRVDIAYAVEYAGAIRDLMVANPDVAALDHDTLVSIDTQITQQLALFTPLTEDARNAALAELGITMDEINTYATSVKVEIEIDNLTGYKTAVDAVIAGVPDVKAATDEQLTAALAQAKEQLGYINNCTQQAAFDAVFGEAGTDYITTFIHDVQVEMDVRELESGLTNYGEYFAAHMADNLTLIDTATLIDSYRTPDQAKFAELADYERDAIDAVYGPEWYDEVAAYIASIDTVLTDRVVEQINTAYENYTDVGAISNLNFRSVKDAMDAVETRIINEVLGGTLPEDAAAKYAQFESYKAEYDAFVASKGLANWQKSEVEYPTREIMAGDVARVEGEEYEVTAEKLDTVINSLDGLMQNPEVGNLLAGLGVTGIEGAISDLIKGAISDNLYTDQMVNTIISSVYGILVSAMTTIDLGTLQGLLDAVGGIEDILADIDVVFTPGTVAPYMHGELYPEAKAAMEAAGSSWDNYDMNVTWHVTDRESFVNAVSYGLCGLQTVLRPLLSSSSYSGKALSIADVNIEAVNMYGNDILPLLKLLGCENVMTAEEYNNTSRGDGNALWSQDLLPPILNPLLEFVEGLADAPVSTLLDVLPKLAYVMDFDLITQHLQNININITIKALFGLVNVNVLQEALKTTNLYGILMSDTVGLNLNPAIFNDVNELIKMVLGLVAPDANLVLPTIDQAYLASLGTLTKDGDGYLTYATDKPAVLLAVLRYVLGMVGDADFMDALFALIGQMTGSEIALGDDVMNIITGLGTNPDGVICALTELFVPQEYAAQEYTYKYAPASVDEEGNLLPVNTVEYSENWTKEEAQYIADNLDEFVDNMMTILGGADMPGLGDLIRSYIADEFYTNEMINTIVITIRDALNGIGIDLAPILDLVDVDLSSWNSVTESTNWGVVPGDSVTFAAGLSQALSPLTPLLSFLLTGEDISVLGTITANGYNGYQNGIVPLLENLGCNTAYIHSYDEYVARVNQDPSRALNDILTPILNLVDRIYQNPIDTIIDILPNLLYFIDCGGLTTAIKNVAQSAFVLLDTVRPIYNISFDLNFNLQQILVDLLANLEVGGQKLNLKIPFLNDLSLLMVGTVTPYDSKSDLQPYYMLMNTDKADFVTVLMRNVVDLLFYEENQKVITDLIANQAGLDQETADSLLEIFNTFATMYQEDNGVDKILHAAYVIFQTTHETAGGALTDIKDFNERWSAVFETLQSQGGFLADFADWADGVLDFLSFGLITGDGVGTSGLIDFFERLVAFFQGKITDVSIDRTSADMLVGEQTTLSLSFKPVTVKNKNAAWTSSNERVATVENGVVTAVGVGDTEIKATTEDGGFVVSCVVRVRANKADLNAAIAKVEGTTLTEDQLAQINDVLATAKEVAANELASQDSVNEACAALLDAFNALDLGTPVTAVTITQNGAPVGEIVYQKVSWMKKWNSTPVTLGVQINGGELGIDDVKRVSWEYADWSVDKPEADIEPNGMEATIRAKNSVIGAHSCWIQVTVEDAYGYTVTSNPVKVRFYNYDWQK